MFSKRQIVVAVNEIYEKEKTRGYGANSIAVEVIASRHGIRKSDLDNYRRGKVESRPTPYREYEFLNTEYVIKGRTAKSIADQCNVTEGSILRYLKRNHIEARKSPPPPMRPIVNPIINGMKRCRDCKASKPLTDFCKNKRVIGGHDYACRSCMKERHRNNRDKYRDMRFRRLYGLDNYLELYEAQNGQCAICKEPQEKYRGLHVDHNHNTGAVRGLLCNSCNMLVGTCKENPEVLESAKRYLQK